MMPQYSKLLAPDSFRIFFCLALDFAQCSQGLSVPLINTNSFCLAVFLMESSFLWPNGQWAVLMLMCAPLLVHTETTSAPHMNLHAYTAPFAVATKISKLIIPPIPFSVRLSYLSPWVIFHTWKPLHTQEVESVLFGWNCNLTIQPSVPPHHPLTKRLKGCKWWQLPLLPHQCVQGSWYVPCVHSLCTCCSM